VVWRTVASIESATPNVTPEVTPEVGRLLQVLVGEMSRAELMICLGLKDEKHFSESYKQVAANTGMVEMTLPNKPKNRHQKYRLSAMRRAHAKQMNQGDN